MTASANQFGQKVPECDSVEGAGASSALATVTFFRRPRPFLEEGNVVADALGLFSIWRNGSCAILGRPRSRNARKWVFVVNRNKVISMSLLENAAKYRFDYFFKGYLEFFSHSAHLLNSVGNCAIIESEC